MKLIVVLVLGTIVNISCAVGQITDVTMTILYDNYVIDKHTKAEWGFSCLIEGTDKTILFDTGTKPEILWHNINELGVDVNKIDYIVLSHDHLDHTGGIWSILEKNPDITVYLLNSFDQSFKNKIRKTGAEVLLIGEPVEICHDVFSTGKMGTRIKEQSLILNTEKGLVIITGCSHQGVVNILKRSKEIIDKSIYLVFGGFHLMNNTPAQLEEIINSFKEIGVEYCGATHCTGNDAIKAFKDAYGKKYRKMGTGKVIII